MANEKYIWMNKTDPELFNLYRTATGSQKRYIDLRVSGLTKARAYKGAGYKTANPTQAACVMEKNHPFMKRFIEMATDYNSKKKITEMLNDPSKKIDDFMKEMKNASIESELLVKGTHDDIKRLHFYEDICNGNVRQKITTKTKNENGELVISKVEIKEPTISERISARKEMDKILGLRDTVAENVGQLDTPDAVDFEFKIVDTSDKSQPTQEEPNNNNEIIETELEE
jgi:hypothetical protein